jgi:3-phosphoshikimate 1-carboxyvinyltransferase
VGELRVKESDRVRAVRELLGACDVEAWEEGEDLLVRGGRPRVGGRLTPARDHRMVMAAGALAHGALAAAGEGTCTVVGADEASVSFPGFFAALAASGGRP